MMLRWIIAGGVGVALLASFIIHPLKHGSQELQGEIRVLRHDIRQEKSDIDVLRAEWSHLTAPQRLQALARRHLPLQPIDAGASLFHIEDLPWRQEGAEEQEIFHLEEQP